MLNIKVWISNVRRLDGSELHDMCAWWSASARTSNSASDTGFAPTRIQVDFFRQLRSGVCRKLALWSLCGNSTRVDSQFVSSAMGRTSLDGWADTSGRALAGRKRRPE